MILLAAVRNVSTLEPAILRPGRLDVHVAVELPDEAQRARLLAQMLAHTPIASEGPGVAEAAAGGEGEGDAEARRATIQWLATKSKGWSLAQLSALCREAAMAALRESIGARSVGARHFESAAVAIN